jgi:ubiquinone/menaquinone biosynthesis C-methylase UbiE
MNFICPRCHSELRKITERELLCVQDGLAFKQEKGIWKFLLPERESHYAQFIKDYERIRHLEGRSSSDSSYYRALPFEDLSKKFSSDWKIRAVSFHELQNLLAANETVLDVGAGNGWLSNRLALSGHTVYAMDLLINEKDGLGAWSNYESQFTKMQSEFVHLPIPNEFITSVIFNASFHYAESYEETLAEALRVLSSNGKIIIIDSPVYYNAKSGEKMVEERKTSFLSQYGFASDAIQSKNYLTYSQMDLLGSKLNIRWKHIRPFYGFRWAIRPWLARLRSSREPAEFGLWVGIRS